MAPLGDNVIAASGLPPFFSLANPDEAGPTAPAVQLGDAVRTSARSLSGFQKEALVHSSLTGRTWRLVSDEGPYLNGHDAAPCPLAFLSVGMAASILNEVMALARQREHSLHNVRLLLDNYYTMTGSMQRRTMVGGAGPVDVVLEAESDASDDELYSLLVDSVLASPMNGLMKGTLDNLFKLSRNGTAHPTGRVAELDTGIIDNPATSFEEAVVEQSSADFVGPVGVTPKKDVERGTSATGSSLADEQNRQLNIGAIAAPRDDGMLDVLQLQYSPHGTSFRFLSSEDGRAPDANSLASAGLGFCFMTQFGRLASMLRLDLSEYRIVQDTHFSPGGASGGTGLPGSAGPVETHVHLTTGESVETSQEMLDLGEQTCFLHALCRSDVKPRLRVVRPSTLTRKVAP